MTRTNVLVIGDPHFRVDNLQEVDMFISKMMALIEEQNPDFIVCLGDVLHTHERVHTTVLNKAYEFIRKLSQHRKTFILVGNHDYIQNQQFLTQNHWMNAMKEWKNTTIVDSVVCEEKVGEYKFTFLPYVPNGRFASALETAKFDWTDSSCIFAHQEFYGCKMGAIVSIDGDRWDETLPLVVSGHIHSRQRPQKNMYYPGASIQSAFGESEHTTVSLLTFDRNVCVETVELDVGLPKKKIIYTKLDDIKAIDLGKCSKHTKLSISGNDYNEFKSFKKSGLYQELTETGAKVVFKLDPIKPTVAVDADQGSSEIKFKDVLFNLISNDKRLLEVYELVVNKTEVILL